MFNQILNVIATIATVANAVITLILLKRDKK